MGGEVSPKMEFSSPTLQLEHCPWSLKDYYNAFGSSVCNHDTFVLENQCR